MPTSSLHQDVCRKEKPCFRWKMWLSFLDCIIFLSLICVLEAALKQRPQNLHFPATGKILNALFGQIKWPHEDSQNVHELRKSWFCDRCLCFPASRRDTVSEVNIDPFDCVCLRRWLWLLWLVAAAAPLLAVRWLHVDSAGSLLTVPFTVDPLINTILGETWRHLANTQTPKMKLFNLRMLDW